MDLSSEEYNTKCAIFPPFHPLRLGGILAFSCSFLTVSAAEKKQGAASPFWFIPSHGQVFLLGFECLLQAFRLKTVYTL